MEISDIKVGEIYKFSRQSVQPRFSNPPDISGEVENVINNLEDFGKYNREYLGKKLEKTSLTPMGKIRGYMEKGIKDNELIIVTLKNGITFFVNADAGTVTHCIKSDDAMQHPWSINPYLRILNGGSKKKYSKKKKIVKKITRKKK